MLIIWSDEADDELAGILSYFSDKGQNELGMEIVRHIIQLVDKLIDFPFLGRRGRIAETRELFDSLYHYTVIYKVLPTEEAIRISRIVQMSQLFPEIL
jgi:plasmid stabilization system protein ParE